MLKYPFDAEIKKKYTRIFFSPLLHRGGNWGSMRLNGLSIHPELVTGSTRQKHTSSDS